MTSGMYHFSAEPPPCCLNPARPALAATFSKRRPVAEIVCAPVTPVADEPPSESAEAINSTPEAARTETYTRIDAFPFDAFALSMASEFRTSLARRCQRGLDNNNGAQGVKVYMIRVWAAVDAAAVRDTSFFC